MRQTYKETLKLMNRELAKSALEEASAEDFFFYDYSYYQAGLIYGVLDCYERLSTIVGCGPEIDERGEELQRILEDYAVAWTNVSDFAEDALESDEQESVLLALKYFFFDY